MPAAALAGPVTADGPRLTFVVTKPVEDVQDVDAHPGDGIRSGVDKPPSGRPAPRFEICITQRTRGFTVFPISFRRFARGV